MRSTAPVGLVSVASLRHAVLLGIVCIDAVAVHPSAGATEIQRCDLLDELLWAGHCRVGLPDSPA